VDHGIVLPVVSLSVYHVHGVAGRNIFASLSYGNNYTGTIMEDGSCFCSDSGTGSGSGAGGSLVKFTLTQGQRNMVQQVHDMYSLMLASRKYDKIPSNYEQYLDLLLNLQTIAVPTATLKLLLNIVEQTLVGCMNIVQVYESNTYNELQILLLNNRIDDILADKNNKNVVADEANISGQFTVKQTFKLSKFYSYYIYLYGMPEFGVGFDPAKLTFLKNALELFDQTHIQVPPDLLIPDTSGCTLPPGAPHIGPDVPPPRPKPGPPGFYYQESIFEIGYAVNLYDHFMDYQTIYPLGFYIVALLELPPPDGVPASAFEPASLIDTLSYYSEVAGLGGLDSSGGLPADACLNTLIWSGTPDQLTIETNYLTEVQDYLINVLIPGRPIVSHTIIPGGADVFKSNYASYTFYYSTTASVHHAFKLTHDFYGGSLRAFTFKDYNLETKMFTVIDHCGNVYKQLQYQGVV